MLSYNQKGRLNKQMKVRMVCNQCKNVFEVLPSRQYVRKKGCWIKRKFCSVKCSTESLRPFWNGITEREARSNRQTGSRNSNWQGGRCTEQASLRASAKYRDLVQSVFTRDLFTCQKCGKVGGKLHAHHKKSVYNNPELLMDKSNVQTLCYVCHSTTSSFLMAPQVKVSVSNITDEQRRFLLSLPTD